MNTERCASGEYSNVANSNISEKDRRNQKQLRQVLGPSPGRKLYRCNPVTLVFLGAKWWTACCFRHLRCRAQTFAGVHDFGLCLSENRVCFYNEGKSVKAVDGSIAYYCQDLKHSAWKNAEFTMLKLSVKGKVVLEQAMKTQRGSRGIAVHCNFGPRWRVGGQRHSSAALSPGKRPGTYCTEDWMCPWAGLDCCGKSRPGPSIPYESLYRLRYPGPKLSVTTQL